MEYSALAIRTGLSYGVFMAAVPFGVIWFIYPYMSRLFYWPRGYLTIGQWRKHIEANAKLLPVSSLQTTFWSAFLSIKRFEFRLKIIPGGPIYTNAGASIDLAIGLAPNKPLSELIGD